MPSLDWRREWIRLLAAACADRGEFAGRHFCLRCGSSVFARFGDEIEVHLGTLDAPDRFMPSYKNWVIRREAWLPPFPLARHYERDRESGGRSEA